ncbi:class I SAM-dependent methyltransferase [Anaerosalibacter massiliensis]|uniref:Class I SAM-dependent methyltransferase n=1 Tax=Anaerosalibacter massiliensis TaxID=1347392 RepID=A0A9X2MKR4_9FIRM|nr:class I SAM-dependent methyltransferase [Anaerosalibacter massiliensis]MCR2044845.1 class I SAM-dependent methyltransferase [Anaerosalibacter massiliensis]
MKKSLINKELFNYLMDEVNEKFEGWDFSFLESTGRMQEFPLSWNYRNKVMIEIHEVSSLLDMGTGGGEFLSTLDPLPKYTCATEGYKPNILIAKNKLEPLGVKVYEVENDECLPFDDETFELIINKHESYSPKEVKRILKDEGIFVTQQVGGLNDKEINEFLGAPEFEFFDWNLERAVGQLKAVDLKVLEQKEDLIKTRFYDIGAIVYYLKAIPWQVPDFTIERYFDKLVGIHNIIEKLGYIDFTCHRFFIISSKE